MDDIQQVSQKIMKLLALARKAGSVHEAAAAMAKARELLEKYQLNEGKAALEAEGFKEEWHPCGWGQKPRWAPFLASAIATAYTCRVYESSSYLGWVHRYYGAERFWELEEELRGSSSPLGNQIGFVFYGFSVDVDVALHAYDAARHMIIRVSNQMAQNYPAKKRYLARMSSAEGLIHGLSEKLNASESKSYRPVASQNEDLLPVPITSIEEIKASRLKEYEESLDLSTATARKRTCIDNALRQGYKVGKTLNISEGIQQTSNEPVALAQSQLSR